MDRSRAGARTGCQPGEHVYTVAAQTDDAGLQYLTVSVVRTAGGSLALGGYPAFVGAPASGPRTGARRGTCAKSNEPALATVVGRALRNYLSASGSELAADLTSGARVSLPAAALSLESVQRLDWAPGAGAVLAVVRPRTRAARGTRSPTNSTWPACRAAGRSPRSR